MFDMIFSVGSMIFKLIIPMGYVTGVSSFPQPLTSEEEQQYLIKYRDGDYEARNILIERNLRLVAHVVKKYNSLNISNDDLISIGTIGLIKAITSFNYDKGTRLATYAARCIENAILFCVTHITPFLFLLKKMATVSTF
jgi:RNA polymerase sporulation-specific sigma factor